MDNDNWDLIQTWVEAKHGIRASDPLETQNAIRLLPKDRWEILQRALTLLPRAKLDIFIHVPKTGGTTLGQNLSSQHLRNVVSCDAPNTVFFQLLRQCFVTPNPQGILARGHHGYTTIFSQIDRAQCASVFSVFREPLDIQVSNINMIARRMRKFYAGEDQGLSTNQFCENWHAFFQDQKRPFQESAEFCIWLASTELYQRTMGGIYDKFFGACTDEELRSIRFVELHAFDAFVVDMFQFAAPPPRLNQTDNSLFLTEHLSDTVRAQLTAADAPIVDRIKSLL